jgi:hypothetical protein
MERVQRQMRVTLQHQNRCPAEEYGQDGELDVERVLVHLRRDIHAEQVRHCGDRDEERHPHPRGHRGHDGGHRARREHAQQRGQEQIVEQNRPARHESEEAVRPEADVAVGRPREGEHLGHLLIADGTEQHRDRGDHIDRGYRPGRHVVQDPEHADGCQRHHVDQSVDHQVPHGQSSCEFGFVSEFAQPRGVIVELHQHGGLLKFFGPKQVLLPFEPKLRTRRRGGSLVCTTRATCDLELLRIVLTQPCTLFPWRGCGAWMCGLRPRYWCCKSP